MTAIARPDPPQPQGGGTRGAPGGATSDPHCHPWRPCVQCPGAVLARGSSVGLAWNRATPARRAGTGAPFLRIWRGLDFPVYQVRTHLFRQGTRSSNTATIRRRKCHISANELRSRMVVPIPPSSGWRRDAGPGAAPLRHRAAQDRTAANVGRRTTVGAAVGPGVHPRAGNALLSERAGRERLSRAPSLPLSRLRLASPSCAPKLN